MSGYEEMPYAKKAYMDQEKRKSFIGGGQNADYSGLDQGAVQGCAINSNSKYDEAYIVEQLFTYHPATPFSGPKFETIREAAKYFAKVILANTSAGADRTAAIRKLREAVFTANAGIALGGLGL
jgi:hypothetical protein